MLVHLFLDRNKFSLATYPAFFTVNPVFDKKLEWLKKFKRIKNSIIYAQLNPLFSYVKLFTGSFVSETMYFEAIIVFNQYQVDFLIFYESFWAFLGLWKVEILDFSL